MEEKFVQDEARNNNVEYNSLVSAYSKAYPVIPSLEVTAKARTKWAELKERYVIGMFSVSNLNFDKYSTHGNIICTSFFCFFFTGSSRFYRELDVEKYNLQRKKQTVVYYIIVYQ